MYLTVALTSYGKPPRLFVGIPGYNTMTPANLAAPVRIYQNTLPKAQILTSISALLTASTPPILQIEVVRDKATDPPQYILKTFTPQPSRLTAFLQSLHRMFANPGANRHLEVEVPSELTRFAELLLKQLPI